MVSSEVKLVTAAAGLYSSFLYWGYLQEKITGAEYVSPLDATVTGRWQFSFVLNGKSEHFSAEATQSEARSEEIALAVFTSLVALLFRRGHLGFGRRCCFSIVRHHVAGLNESVHSVQVFYPTGSLPHLSR